VSHYDVLGVAPTADDAAVRHAYVTLARRHHPDLAGGDAARMRAINEAWTVLGDPIRRARYDRTLAGWTTPTPSPSKPSEWDDDWADDDDARDIDLDDRPIHATVQLPGWMSLLPVALFAVAVGAFVAGAIFESGPILGFGLMAFVLSCLFFLAAPFMALFAARTGDRGDEDQQ
jgi:curved DNA-binding protein CbpA